MTTDIFIRTYAGDAGWLAYCLRSVDRFTSGFSRIIVTCPEYSVPEIKPLAEKHGCEFYACEKMHDEDYVGQQATKLLADTWCDADNILHLDADTVFIRKTVPEDYARDGRLVILKTPYSLVGDACCWKEVTLSATGIPVEYEYMRRMPLVYPRALYGAAREVIEKHNGKTFREFIACIPGRHFSEFNVLGAVAEALHPEWFYFLDTTAGELPEPTVKQFWSWGNLSVAIQDEMERTLAGGVTPGLPKAIPL